MRAKNDWERDEREREQRVLDHHTPHFPPPLAPLAHSHPQAGDQTPSSSSHRLPQRQLEHLLHPLPLHSAHFGVPSTNLSCHGFSLGAGDGMSPLGFEQVERARVGAQVGFRGD